MIIEAREDTITLRGAIKSNIWPAIQAAAALLLREHPTGIIIDSSGVSKCTVKGAETFADAFEYIKANNARVVVAGLAPELVEIGKAVPGVRAQLPLADTVEQARASLRLEEVAPHRGSARIAAVVPMVGDWRRAVFHADRLALGENCEVHLVDLIRVPYSLPQSAPMPEREVAGQSRVQAAMALVRQTGLQGFSHVERVRSYSAGLVDFTRILKADFAVASIDPGELPDLRIEESEALSMLEMADFEVSLIKGSPDDPSSPISSVVVPAVGGWNHALEHACKLTAAHDGTVTGVFLMTVPRALSIDAALPDAEAAASDFAAEAKRISKRYGANTRTVVERVRDPILAFTKMIESGGFDLVVVGERRKDGGDRHIARAIADSVMHHPYCETVLLRVGGAPD